LIVVGLKLKNIECNGIIYQINVDKQMEVSDSVGYILAANGYVKPIEYEGGKSVPMYELWGTPNTTKRTLKKYTGSKTNICINAETESQVTRMASKYRFDDYTGAIGKYRFYGGDWNSQIQKRSSYFREDRINIILDTDEELHGKVVLPKGVDVGWVKLTNNGNKERWQPRVFRGIEGMHYLKRHHWIFDGNGDLIASHSKEGPKYKHARIGVSIDNLKDLKFATESDKSRRGEYRRHIFNKELCHPEATESNLYITHINNEDMAGLSVRLSDAINEHTRHASISFRAVDNYMNFKKDRSVDDEEYDQAVKTADILVFNETYPIGNTHHKPTIMIHHGTWYRNHLESIKKQDDVADVILGTTTDLLQNDSRMLYLPSIVDTDYLRSLKDTPIYDVAHTTTSRIKKGTDEIIKYLPDIHIIEGLSYADAMAEKAKSRIVVDQVSELGIGLGAIEAMAMGIPVISCAGDEAIKQYKKIFGFVPFTNCKPEGLPEAVKYVEDNYKKLSKEAQEFVEKYHSPEVCAKRFEKICQSALMGKKLTQGDLC